MQETCVFTTPPYPPANELPIKANFSGLLQHIIGHAIAMILTSWWLNNPKRGSMNRRAGRIEVFCFVPRTSPLVNETVDSLSLGFQPVVHDGPSALHSRK
jgi:hypothetical protein